MVIFHSYVSLPEGIYIYYDAKLPVHDIHNSTFLASGVLFVLSFNRRLTLDVTKATNLCCMRFKWNISYQPYLYHDIIVIHIIIRVRYIYTTDYIYIHILYFIGIQYILDILHPVYIICELMRFLPRRRLHPESALEKSWEQRNIDRKTWGFAWENIRKPKFWHLHEHSFFGGMSYKYSLKNMGQRHANISG